ncbi:uncharacterized protein LOC135400491 [Ornithodoros turicata]|uniref:uncharacterized protein LOC135400491 n=1 Tax=Ornithodoros turicata TaxID=34597 RepID=UPI0031389A19
MQSTLMGPKALEHVIGKSFQDKKLSSGDIQVEVNNKEQSIALQSLKNIGEIAVSVTTHRTLNTVKGVISEEELIECSETEIEEGLKEQGLVSAKRIIMRRDGKEIPTKHIILSFKLHTLPSTIKAGYVNCHVRSFIPNPRRCFKCQRFGHSSQVCRGQLVCPRCAGKEHTPESCTKDFHCANCEGGHPVYSRSCPRWKEEKEILKIKTEQNLNYRDARAQLKFRKKGSFSDVVRRGVALPRKSVETQTCFSGSESPLYTPQPEKAGDTPVSSAVTEASRSTGRRETATASSKVDGTQSVWDGVVKTPSQKGTQGMEVDDDDCMSQKSSSSLPSIPSQGKEKREKGRGRGFKGNDQQKQPLRRVQPP